LLWSKQFYHFEVAEWLTGDPVGTNATWYRIDGGRYAGAELDSVCDVAGERAQTAALASGVPGFASVAELLHARRPEAAYVATPDDSRQMAAAGADCIVTHSGPTTGGLGGYRYDGSLSDLIRDTEQIIQAARAVSPDVVCLIHGGLLATPDEVQAALYQTSAVGFVGASSIERIPIERAVMATTRAFKALRVGRADASAPVEPVAMRAVSLQTSDLGRSEAFYARILGLRTVESHPNRRVMDGHGMTLELMQADGTGMGAGAITLEVRDLDAARHRLVGWGLEVTEEHLAGGRRGLMISDPGGAVVKLRAPTPA